MAESTISAIRTRLVVLHDITGKAPDNDQEFLQAACLGGLAIGVLDRHINSAGDYYQ